jgi:cell division protein FtsL
MSEKSSTGLGNFAYAILLLTAIIIAIVMIAQNQRQVDATQQKIDELKASNALKEKENLVITDNIKKMNTPEFIEKIARDELNMAGPNETIYEFHAPAKKSE